MFDVSIIMPVYNVKDSLPRAIESALAQKKVIGEIILIDDGSTDGSRELCKEYAEREPLLITVINQDRRGLGAALNVGIRKAAGKYIYFTDPRGYLSEYLLADTMELVKKDKTDLIVFGYTKELDKKTNTREMRLPNIPQMESHQEFIRHFRNFYHFSPYTLWNKIYRKEFLLTSTIRFNTQSSAQNLEALFNIDVFRNAGSVKIRRGAYYHLVSPGSSATDRYKPDCYKINIKTAQTFEQLIHEWDKAEQFSDLIADEYFDVLYKEMANLLHPDCPFKTEEKTLWLTDIWEDIGHKVTVGRIKDEKNPFRYALLYELKNAHPRNALFLMKSRNQAARQYTKPFNRLKTFFQN